MTPAQLGILSNTHAKVNNPDGHKSNGMSNNNKGSRRLNRLDPDDVRTPAVLAGLASMKLPRKRQECTMANEIAPISVKFTVDTTGLKKAESAISQSGEQIKGKFSGIGKGAGLALAAGITAAAVGIGKTVISAIKTSIDAASNLEESISKTSAVFGDEALPALEDWAAGASTAFGQSKQQALEAAGSYGNLLQAFGLTREQAQGMSVDMVELASDLASFNNTSVDDALNAIRSGLSGETEPLKRFGVALSEVRLKETAEEMGLVAKGTKGPLSVAIKSQAAYALILKDTSLAQGDFARTSDGLANSQRTLESELANVKTEIGVAFIPIMKELVIAFRDALPEIKEKLVPALGEMADKFKADILPALITLIPAITGLFILLAENIDTVVTLVTTLGTLTAIIKTFTVLQAGLNLVLYGNPILLVVAAVALLVAGIVYLATQTTFFQDTWQKLAEAFSYVKTVIADTFENAKATISGFFDTIFGFLNGLGDQLYSFGKTAWEMFVQGALDALLTLPSLVADVVGSIPGLEWLGDGINSGIGAVRDTVSAATGTTNRGQTNQPARGQVVNNYNVQARGLTVSEVARDAKRRSNLMSPVLGGA